VQFTTKNTTGARKLLLKGEKYREKPGLSEIGTGAPKPGQPPLVLRETDEWVVALIHVERGPKTHG
jgi:hypothetical protein